MEDEEGGIRLCFVFLFGADIDALEACLADGDILHFEGIFLPFEFFGGSVFDFFKPFQRINGGSFGNWREL